MAANEYVGSYRTSAIAWAGLRGRSNDAGALSETIRFQQARVTRFAREERGMLLTGIAFCDVQHDRATDI